MPAWSMGCLAIWGLFRAPIWDMPILPIPWGMALFIMPRTCWRTPPAEYCGPFIIWFCGCGILLTLRDDIGIEFNILFPMFGMEDIDIEDNADDVEFASENDELLDTNVLSKKWDDAVVPCLFCTSPWGGDCKLFDSGLFTALFNAVLLMLTLVLAILLFTLLLTGVGTFDNSCDNCWWRWLALSWLVTPCCCPRSTVPFCVDPVSFVAINSSGKSVAILFKRLVISEMQTSYLTYFTDMYQKAPTIIMYLNSLTSESICYTISRHYKLCR